MEKMFDLSLWQGNRFIPCKKINEYIKTYFTRIMSTTLWWIFKAYILSQQFYFIYSIFLCSIDTLLKITSAFYKLLFHRKHLVRKNMPSITCQGYISTGSTVKINPIFVMSLLKREQRSRRSILSEKLSYLHLKDTKPSGETWALLFFWASD
jgi:hypothetical protein